jgi:hypothetical protein
MKKIYSFDKQEYLDDLINADRIIGFRDIILPINHQRALRNSNEIVEYDFFPTNFGNYVKVKKAYCYIPEQPKDYVGDYDINF